jgi:type IX secretion system PorP/SprF family membrane protein
MSISIYIKMKYILSAFACLVFLGLAQAQDEGIYTHYHINPTLINPAAAGFNDYQEVFLHSRLQFAGVDGAPKSYALSYNGRVAPTFGIGAMLFREDIASLTRTRLQLNYAFQFNRFENLKLGLGFSTEFESNRVPASYMENPLVDTDDILLIETTDGKSYFDAAFGVWGEYKENTWFGLSIPNLISQRIGGTNIVDPDDSGFARFYMLAVGHEFAVEGYNFILEPSILIRKALDSPFGVDFNLKAKYLEERIIAGLSYRTGTGGNVALLLGTRVQDSFRIFYSYDFTFQRFQRYNGGSHELTLSFEFGKEEKDRAAKRRL